jgi:radical SAM protein with 4Fe4S-binding SPASM domain
MKQITKTIKKINKSLLPGRLLFDPEYIVLGVNNICNLHCKMCDIGTKNTETSFAQNLIGTKPLNMPIELIKIIFDQLAEFFPKTKIGYAFTEPLIYPHLKESLQYALEKGLKTTITTNGYVLKEKAQDIVEGGVKELFISLDGLEKTHNFTRGNDKSFQRAIAGIEEISRHENAPLISVFFVITEWNYSEMVKFADYFSSLPIKHIGFLHQNFVTKEQADNHNYKYGSYCKATYSNVECVDFSKIDLKKLKNEIELVKSKTYPFSIGFSPEMESLDQLEKFYFHPEIRIGKICNDVFTNMMIKSDGSVIPAHGRCYNLKMGNVYANNLKEIWNSNDYAHFRKELLKAGGLFPACSRCCSAF